MMLSHRLWTQLSSLTQANLKNSQWHRHLFFSLAMLLPLAVSAQYNYTFSPGGPSDGGTSAYDMPDQILGTEKIVRVTLPPFAGNSCIFGGSTEGTITASTPSYGTLYLAWGNASGPTTSWTQIQSVYVPAITIPFPFGPFSSAKLSFFSIL